MKSLVKERLPKFTKEEISLVLKSYDFIGMNYYTTYYAKDDPSLAKAKPSVLTDMLASASSMHLIIIYSMFEIIIYWKIILNDKIPKNIYN